MVNEDNFYEHAVFCLNLSSLAEDIITIYIVCCTLADVCTH